MCGIAARRLFFSRETEKKGFATGKMPENPIATGIFAVFAVEEFGEFL